MYQIPLPLLHSLKPSPYSEDVSRSAVATAQQPVRPSVHLNQDAFGTEDRAREWRKVPPGPNTVLLKSVPRMQSSKLQATEKRESIKKVVLSVIKTPLWCSRLGLRSIPPRASFT